MTLNCSNDYDIEWRSDSSSVGTGGGSVLYFRLYPVESFNWKKRQNRIDMALKEISVVATKVFAGQKPGTSGKVLPIPTS